MYHFICSYVTSFRSYLYTLCSQLSRGQINTKVSHSFEHMKVFLWYNIKGVFVQVFEQIFGLIQAASNEKLRSDCVQPSQDLQKLILAALVVLEVEQANESVVAKCKVLVRQHQGLLVEIGLSSDQEIESPALKLVESAFNQLVINGSLVRVHNCQLENYLFATRLQN